MKLVRLCDLTQPRRERASPKGEPDMPFIGMENIESHSRRVLRFERAGDYKSDGFRFFPGDILYGRLRPYLNKVWCADREGICSGEFIVLPPSKSIDSSLLAYALSQHDFVCFASDLNRGDRPRVTFEQIGEYELEIPETVEEQKRLAARLNRITAHLGEVKARLATIPPLLKRSRQSILAAACSGRLTEDWRKRKNTEIAENIVECIRKRVITEARTPSQRANAETIYSHSEELDSEELPTEWKFVALDKLATFTYGTSAKSQKTGEIPVLRMGNLQRGEIDWSDLVFTSDPDEIEKYELKPMTVLFNRTNSPELVGKTSIYRGERQAIFAGYLIRINNVPELLPEYLNYCLNSYEARSWCNQVKSDGVSQSNINAQKLGKFEIPFCSSEEQAEIVRRVRILFQQADDIEARYNKAMAFVDKLMPSILAKAFRGELA